MIEERLPNDIMEKWVEIVTGDDRISIGSDKFPALMKLLLQFEERIEYRQSSMRMSCHRNVLANAADGRIKEDGLSTLNNKRPWCWLHPNCNDHPIWRCKLFEEKTGLERINLLKSNNACFSCFSLW